MARKKNSSMIVISDNNKSPMLIQSREPGWSVAIFDIRIMDTVDPEQDSQTHSQIAPDCRITSDFQQFHTKLDTFWFMLRHNAFKFNYGS